MSGSQGGYPGYFGGPQPGSFRGFGQPMPQVGPDPFGQAFAPQPAPMMGSRTPTAAGDLTGVAPVDPAAPSMGHGPNDVGFASPAPEALTPYRDGPDYPGTGGIKPPSWGMGMGLYQGYNTPYQNYFGKY